MSKRISTYDKGGGSSAVVFSVYQTSSAAYPGSDRGGSSLSTCVVLKMYVTNHHTTQVIDLML